MLLLKHFSLVCVATSLMMSSVYAGERPSDRKAPAPYTPNYDRTIETSSESSLNAKRLVVQQAQAKAEAKNKRDMNLPAHQVSNQSKADAAAQSEASEVRRP